MNPRVCPDQDGWRECERLLYARLATRGERDDLDLKEAFDLLNPVLGDCYERLRGVARSRLDQFATDEDVNDLVQQVMEGIAAKVHEQISRPSMVHLLADEAVRVAGGNSAFGARLERRLGMHPLVSDAVARPAIVQVIHALSAAGAEDARPSVEAVIAARARVDVAQLADSVVEAGGVLFIDSVVDGCVAWVDEMTRFDLSEGAGSVFRWCCAKLGHRPGMPGSGVLTNHLRAGGRHQRKLSLVRAQYVSAKPAVQIACDEVAEALNEADEAITSALAATRDPRDRWILGVWWRSRFSSLTPENVVELAHRAKVAPLPRIVTIRRIVLDLARLRREKRECDDPPTTRGEGELSDLTDAEAAAIASFHERMSETSFQRRRVALLKRVSRLVA